MDLSRLTATEQLTVCWRLLCMHAYACTCLMIMSFVIHDYCCHFPLSLFSFLISFLHLFRVQTYANWSGVRGLCFIIIVYLSAIFSCWLLLLLFLSQVEWNLAAAVAVDVVIAFFCCLPAACCVQLKFNKFHFTSKHTNTYKKNQQTSNVRCSMNDEK